MLYWFDRVWLVWRHSLAGRPPRRPFTRWQPVLSWQCSWFSSTWPLCLRQPGPASVQGFGAPFQERKAKLGGVLRPGLWNHRGIVSPTFYCTKQVQGQPTFPGEEMDATCPGSSCENVAVFNLPQYTPHTYMRSHTPFFRPLFVCRSQMPGSPHGEPVSEFLHKGRLGNSSVGRGLISGLVFKTDRRTYFSCIEIYLHAEKFTFLVSSSMSAGKRTQLC